MTDRLDDLLSRMPAESLPDGLVVRVQARLHARRRMEAWMARGERLVLVGSAAVGVWLLLIERSQIGNLMPNLSIDVLLQWLTGVAASPQTATLQAASGAIAWGDWLSSQMNLPMLLALILLAAPATAILFALLKEPAGRRGALA